MNDCKCNQPTLQTATRQCGSCGNYIDRVQHILLTNHRDMKVEKTIWFTTNQGCMGIVLCDNGFEKKAYIKQVEGIDKEKDIQDVLNWGAKITPGIAEQIANHLK